MSRLKIVMKINNKICVFDLETDGINPRVCSPVQIAAIIIDPIKMEIVKDSEFNIMVKPEKLEEDDSYEYDSEILNFHAKVRQTTPDNILQSWKDAMTLKQGWSLFTEYLQKYHSISSKKNEFSAPIAAGYNIHRFDLPIMQRLSTKFKTVNKDQNSTLFYPRDTLDIMNLVYYWFMYIDDINSLALDNIRDYFAISKESAHDALKDVNDCANIIIRFLKLHKNLSTKIKFKGSFADV